MILADPTTREEWLEARTQGIGGSDAACIVGANPWKSARQLWKEKTGAVGLADISNKPAVRFGKDAEAPVRYLYMMMHPELQCDYHEFRMYANDEYPFLYATLDGELTMLNGVRGIYEGKTTTIQNSRQWKDWINRVPDHYYVQMLHQLLACEWAEFVTLNAFIRYFSAAKMQSYTIWREEHQVAHDLNLLLDAEIRFWNYVQDGTEPPYILPEI